MKFLSIRQPWASLIISGMKTIENRDWNSLPQYRGPVAIHAGLKREDLEQRDIKRIAKFIGKQLYELPHFHTTGAIIGIAQLTDAWWIWNVPKTIKREQRLFISGTACLHFSKAMPLLEPIPMKGRLGLVQLPDEYERQVEEELMTYG